MIDFDSRWPWRRCDLNGGVDRQKFMDERLAMATLT
jgi:hypothetical protein